MLLLLMVVMVVVLRRVHYLANTDVVTAHFEQIENRGTVAMLEDDFVAFGTEFEDVGLVPFAAAVATHMLAVRLQAHGDDCARPVVRSKVVGLWRRLRKTMRRLQ
jgi:hypothetical protein